MNTNQENTKRNRSLIIATAVATIGLILIVIGYVAGGMQGLSVSANGVELYGKNGESVPLSETYSNVTSIDADVDIRDITLKEGTEFKVESKGVGKNFQTTLENGKLKISESDSEGFSFSLFTIGFFNGSDEYSDLVITYPAGSKFENVNIESDSGLVEISDAHISRLDLDNDMGDIKLNNIIVDSLNASVDSGKLTLDKVNADSFKFEMDMGNLKATNFTGGKVSGESSSGTVSIAGTVVGPVDIYNDLGNINLRLNGTENQYSYELESDLGSIKVNNKKSEGKLTTIYDNKPKIKLLCDSGNIDISFK